MPKSSISDWVRGNKIPDPRSCEKIADALNVDPDLVLVMAGHRPNIEDIKPGDTRLELIGYIKRIRLTADRETGMRAILRAWLEADSIASRS